MYVKFFKNSGNLLIEGENVHLTDDQMRAWKTITDHTNIRNGSDLVKAVLDDTSVVAMIIQYYNSRMKKKKSQ